MKKLIFMGILFFLTSAVRAEEKVFTVLSSNHLIDHPIPHMQGDEDPKFFTIGHVLGTPVIWFTGVNIHYESSKTSQRMPDTLLCHGNVGFLGKGPKGQSIVLSQGNMDVHLPKGYGIPFLANQPLHATSMAVDPSYAGKPYSVYAKFEVLAEPDSSDMKPLFRTAIMPKLPDDGFVPPGRHRYYGRATALTISGDNAIHLITFHLHAYSESMELWDSTTHTLLYKSFTKTDAHGNILDIPIYRSREGIPVFKSHFYKAIATYNNTTDAPVDAMAIMGLYLEDKTFDRSQMKIDLHDGNQPACFCMKGKK